jgi:hydroxymethylpyrimidine/phosphomethylpyrimidine kinase
LKIALSIAGSDSGAGAGIQADLKTFSALDVYGCTAITAITAQNTEQVAEILEVLPSKLTPLCSLITPNRMEAEKLADIVIKTENDAIEAARKIKKLGAENVIVKGGHFSSAYVTDLLLDSKGKIMKFTNPRLKIKEIHGSGCNFSSAVTAYLAKDVALAEACKMANEYVHTAIRDAVRIGRGLPIANPISVIYRDASRYHILEELQQAAEEVSMLDGFYRLVPETQTNFAYALLDAADISDVAAVRGRIIKIENTAGPASYVKFGASSHVASAIIAYMSINPDFRSAINIRFDGRIVKVCKSLFSAASYDRTKEPRGIKRREGSSVAWGILAALSKNSRADVIYHTGDVGKEPMITLFGRNPAEIVQRIKRLLEKI